MAAPVIPTRIVPSAELSPSTPQQVAREFHRLIDSGVDIRCVGEFRRRPKKLLSIGYTPKAKLELFDTTFYMTYARQNPDIRFFVAYVVQANTIHPRLFYKDVSLIWRSASHFVQTDDENWVGKGELRSFIHKGQVMEASAEETTDLPLEIQSALEALLLKSPRIPRDDRALARVLRRGNDDRYEAYRDFTGPRRRARSNPRNRINGGRSIARFTRKNDPSSLRFVKGYEPDFGHGLLEKSASKSRLYGGELWRYRILSKNRKIQYLFFAGPRHVWIIPPQALTAELSSYGVRTIDVISDEDLCIPGYEYHFVDDTEDPPVLVSQIPEGFVGEASAADNSRADASPWLDRLPVVREFRRNMLGRR